MPPERKPLEHPRAVRTVPIGHGIRFGDAVVLAVPHFGDIRYLVWTNETVRVVKPGEFSENAPVVGD